jgi:putative ABC transport system ATP-binding protein
MIELQGVVKRYERPVRIEILRGIDLTLSAGLWTSLMGPSGSGKSTLLSILAGLDLPSEGRVLVDGVDLGSLSEDGRARLRAEKMGFVFQSFRLLPALTVLENVLVPLEIRGLSGAAERTRALELLERVGLSHRLTHSPLQLSGGEQQRVAIARAFVARPKILFADEPTGNLDSSNSRKILELLRELQRDSGATLVVVSHDPEVAALADLRVRMSDGRLETQA